MNQTALFLHSVITVKKLESMYFWLTCNAPQNDGNGSIKNKACDKNISAHAFI